MITEIKYKDKVALQNDTTIADENKVTAEDMNEIKNVINENAKELEKTQDDNTTNKQDIANIKTKNTEQDTYIEELEAENARLRKDLDALPSAQASGEYIHVEDSAESRFKSFKIGGNSKQETREGYNLANYKNSATKSDVNFEIGDVESGKTYTLYLNVQGTLAFNLKYGANGSNIATSYDITGKYIKTFEASESGILYMNGFSTTNYNGISEIMLLEGTYTKDNLPVYEAYGAKPSLEFESEVQTVKDSVNVTICNKNLLKFNDKENNGITYTRSKITIKNPTNYLYGSTNFSEINKINDKVTISLKVNGKVSAETVSVILSTNIDNYRFSTVLNAGTYTDKIYTKTIDLSSEELTNLRVQPNGTVNCDLEIDVQIEEGSVATDYVEHEEQTFTILTQQPFRAIGDIRDTFIKKNNKWFERHYIFRKIFDGTETFTKKTINEVTNFYMSLEGIGSQKGYCNILPVVNNDSYIANILFIWNKLNGFSMMFDANRFGTLSDYKSYLKSLYDADTPVYLDYVLKEPLNIECTSEQNEILDQMEKEAQSYKNITNIYSTDELSPVFEVEYRKKIESKTILSETVRKIVIVDDYPDVEEDGVLYLKKGTGSSSSGGGEMLTNLYYQDSDKEYTSSSSGYSCNWRTTKTVEINSNTYMTKDAQRSSNTFTLDLKENTTYKLVFNYVSGSGTKETEIGKINYSLWNETTSTKLISQSTECGVSSEVTFTSTATETITAEMQMYLYTDVHYQDLIYEIGLYEVS